MNAYIFPGQGAQFVGMGLDLYEKYPLAQKMFETANEILGFSITDLMFEGTAEDLKETKVTQPAIFLHSVIMSKVMGPSFKPDMVAGHSCELQPSTMAAVLGLDDAIVEKVCAEIAGIVVPANYNCPGQLVISGEVEAINTACEKLKEAGARRALVLPVGGAFHSPLMEPAREELAAAIENTVFKAPSCAIYQNVPTTAVSDPEAIKANLIAQLTAPVKWTQSVQQMVADGASLFIEVGPGKVLQGLVKKIHPAAETMSAELS